MSKMVKEVKDSRKAATTKAVTNFMGGTSYELNPLDTLKMISASSIFGEPQYYRAGEFAEANVTDGRFGVDALFAKYSVLSLDKFNGKKTSDVMEIAIDEALAYDFEATIRWAATLRHDYFMRLNPQVIMVRAAMHPARVAFNEKNPGVFAEINQKVMSRADEPASQFAYYLFRNGKKNNLPNILKRSWAKKLEGLSKYQMHKYKNKGLGIIDVARVSHAHSETLDELMRTGTIEVEDDENTWEALRKAGKSWREILETTHVAHMALLRNLRGIFTEIDDIEFCKTVLGWLKVGVANGKQFPFRYSTAYQVIDNSNVNHKGLIKDALEECIDIAANNMPKLKGRVACLSDNSGSAWGAFTSEYGSVTVANIGNLSSLITARNADEGYVFKFGDTLDKVEVSKRNGLLKQLNDLEARPDVGQGTETGCWTFWHNAIKNKEHWDTVFIYSDMQAGHGGLYGDSSAIREYTKQGYLCKYSHMDVAKMIETYRREVNPKVNVFCIQTAGYNNVLVPEYGYRTNILQGWTGKEAAFAETMIKLWDEKDAQKAAKKQPQQ